MTYPSLSRMDSKIDTLKGEKAKLSTEWGEHEAHHNSFTIQGCWGKAGGVLIAILFAIASVSMIGHSSMQHKHLGIVRRLSYPVNTSAAILRKASVHGIPNSAMDGGSNTTVDFVVQTLPVERFCIQNDAECVVQFVLHSAKMAYLSVPFPPGRTHCIHGDKIGARSGEHLLCSYFFNQIGLLCPGTGHQFGSSSGRQANYLCFGNMSPIQCEERHTTSF